MKTLLAVISLAALVAAPQSSSAEDIARFPPLKAEELTPPQKAWAEMIAPPPRNAKITNPPYRAYVRNPSWLRDCRRCRIICAGIRRCRHA